jgi:transposase
MKLRLCPRSTSREALATWDRQTRAFDRWSRRARALWNLLLGMERAAYSGEKHLKEVFDWRSIWLAVAEENYRSLAESYDERRKRAEREGRQPPKAPEPPPAGKILARGADGRAPGLFIWEHDLQKLMARLKREPYTRWIGDLPSHACQHVVKDLCKALKNMVGGKARRAAGTSDRKVGFPKFKADRGDGESVYFANTQLQWDIAAGRVRFPADIGWVDFEGGPAARKLRLIPSQVPANKEDSADGRLTRTGEDKFLGARLWRRGNAWWLSAQFEAMAKPAPRFNGRHIAVKVAAGTLATTYDGVTFKSFAGPAEPKHRHGRHMARARSRSVEALTAKKRKITLRAARHRKLKGLAALTRGAFLRRPGGLKAANAYLSKVDARDTNARNDRLHKVSRRIVRMGDSLTIERLDVAGMMAKEQDPAKRREQMKKRQRTRKGEAAGPGGIVHKAPPVVLRKALRRAATARFLDFLKYKAEEAARPVNELHEMDARVIKCGARIVAGERKGETCGHLNYVMQDGRSLHQCGACGATMRRLENAAEVIHQSGRLSRDSGLEAAE